MNERLVEMKMPSPIGREDLIQEIGELIIMNTTCLSLIRLSIDLLQELGIPHPSQHVICPSGPPRTKFTSTLFQDLFAKLTSFIRRG